MLTTHVAATARGWRSLFCIAASLAAILLTVGTVGTASADCTTGGSGCASGSGYTFDTGNFSCGVSPGVSCYASGTTNVGSATVTDWGWGEARYTGIDRITVCVYGGTGPAFGGCGDNDIRACWAANCNDQDGRSFILEVLHFGSVPHTVVGRGKA